jgi:D-amino-acid oxidase
MKTVVVIGAGVSGLTTAYELACAGYRVVIVADQDATQTTSIIAGALWEWPPAVCGHHTDNQSLQRSKPRSAVSYRRFVKLSQTPETGVSIRPSCFYFYQPIAESPFELQKMNETQEHVDGFVHDSSLIGQHQINPSLGLRDAYAYDAPVIHTAIYLQWIREKLIELGVEFFRRTLDGPLDQQLPLLTEFQAKWLINCSGIGARELNDESVYPLRGALVRVEIPESAPDTLRSAHCITHDENKPQQNMIYVVPRGDHLVLGGVAQPNEWSTDLDLQNSADVQGILERCLEFLPQLRQLKIDQEMPVVVGLRPARKQNVRLETDPVLPVVHNYGHGGSGYSMSWGCAAEVRELVEK